MDIRERGICPIHFICFKWEGDPIFKNAVCPCGAPLLHATQSRMDGRGMLYGHRPIVWYRNPGKVTLAQVKRFKETTKNEEARCV